MNLTPPYFNSQTHQLYQGTTQVGAAFEVGIGLITFNYYLMLKHEPKYQTFTWSLDYRYYSDFGT